MTEPDPDEDRGGRDFGTDLYWLKWVGQERMPYIADRLLTANNHVANTGGDSSLVVKDWLGVRDFLQESLGKNGERIQAVGEALLICYETYMDADDANAESYMDAASDLAKLEDYTDGVEGDGIPESEYPSSSEES